MTNGILVCGLNGVGKSTLAKALAEEIGYHFIDIENIYFSPEDNTDYPYLHSRSHEEAVDLLLDVIKKEDKFMLSSVTGHFGSELISQLKAVVYIQVPRELRLQRVYQRSRDRFGEKINEGEEYYDYVRSFHRFVESRDEGVVEDWLTAVSCPIIKVDGTLPVEENVKVLLKSISKQSFL